MTPADKVNELNEAELPAIALLQRLGYTYVPREILAPERDNEREVLLKGRLKAALLRLNPWLKAQDAERVIFALENLDAVGMARNQLVHEYLVYGMPLEVDPSTTVGTGSAPEASFHRTRTVAFFDFQHPERNEYVVTNQMRVRRGSERGRSSYEDLRMSGKRPAGTLRSFEGLRAQGDPSIPQGERALRQAQDEDDERVVKPDIVLFVNGIPLVVIEAKSPTLMDVWKVRAVRQMLRYQEAGPEFHGTGAPELFYYNLACVAICGADAAYAGIGAPENVYSGWKSVEPYTEATVREQFGVEPKGQAQLIVGLLAPATLLEVLRDFVVFEPERGRLLKKLPRYQQFRAVRKAMDRLLTHTQPEERGGVVWHTQGSGKSLTMLWLATKLRREPRLDNPTIVIVTDRTQLDTQITETFKRCGFPAPEHAGSTKELRKLLTLGSGRTIMTTIQKFEDALTGENGRIDSLNDADNVFVMVDEAHRTQYGLLGAKMAKGLPRATFLGFTGTPIDKGFRRSTMRRFGPLIDAYKIGDSVADKATVEILYEARLAELSIIGANTLDHLFDAIFGDEPDDVKAQIRRRYANKEALAEAENRIDMIALDIADHYKTRVKPNGFKCQVVAPSRAAAIKYAAKLCDFGIDAYAIITTTPDDGPEFAAARGLNQEQIVNQFKDPGTPEEPGPEMLVVVDMLLTGFDAPIEQVMYLDKPLREHGLLQAIARVNRRFARHADGVTTEKEYGLIVDYYGVSNELEAALSDFDPRDVQTSMEPLEEDPKDVIEDVARKAEAFFKGKSLDNAWECVEVFVDPATTELRADLFEGFDAAYRDFAGLMDRYLPAAGALAYTDRLTRLTRIRSYVRAQFLRENADVDWRGVSMKVKQLLDSRIDAEVRELMTPVSILDANFQDKISSLPHDEARASVMEHAIRAQIKDRIAENPVFFEKLSHQLQRIIDEMKQRLIDAAEACRRMMQLKQDALGEAQAAADQGLSELSFALYELLEQSAGGRPAEDGGEAGVGEERRAYRTTFDEGLKSRALKIEEIMRRGQSIIDWFANEDVQREMRRDIKRELRELDGVSEEDVEDLARSMVDIARRKAARG